MNNLPAEKNRRVLVIDDNRAIHDDFRKILAPATAAATAFEATEAALFGDSAEAVAQTHFEVDSAYQGQEGVLMAAKAREAGRPYAMAFVDVRMPPGWDGVETTGKLWELDRNLQVVLCTAYTDYSWSEIFEELGERDGLLILKKPFDAVEALQLAHALTEKWWLHQQARRKMEELESMVAGRTQELARSLSLLNATLESTTDGIVAVDLSGNVVSYNARFAAVWQFPAELLARRDVAEMRAHAAGQVKDAAKFLQRTQELQADVEAEGFDVIELKDGRTFERYVFAQRIEHECVGTVISWRDITERRRAEEELRESEDRYRLLVEESPDGIGIYQDGKLVFVNSTATRQLGAKTQAELLGRQSEQIIHPDDLADAKDRIRRRLAGETGMYPAEVRYRRLDGTTVPVEVSAAPLIFDGKPGMQFIARDITERKRAEEALQESEGRFAGAFEHAPIGMALVSPDGRWLKVNGVFCELVGYSEAGLLARTFQDITHPGDLEADLENVRQLIAGEIRSYEMEKRYVHQRGHTVTVLLSVSLVCDGQGQPRYFISHVQDITERKQAEEVLRQRLKLQDQLVHIAATVPGMIYSLRLRPDGSTQMPFASGVLSDLFDLQPKDVIEDASPIFSLIHPDDLGHVQATMAESARTLNPWRADFRVCRTRLAEIWVEGHSVPQRETDGSILWHGFVQNITARKRMEAQLFQSQKLETVGKLAGGVAHEFNNILTTILGQSELILGDLPPGHALSQNAAEISKAAQRAATLARQLLAYGRRTLLQPEALDLNQVIASMADTIRQLLGPAVEVRIAPAAGLHDVKADGGQIEQVIMNLVMNAADAMPNGGNLTLETANVSFDPESVGRYPELKPGDYVMLAITDTGAGMSEAVKARAFEPFFTTKDVGQGTGLGLSTCYGIVKQSGGHMSVYSEPGRGTTFKIYLPQVEPMKLPGQRLDSPDLPRGTEAILLVDDDAALREMGATLLRRLGYTVFMAANGVEALSLQHERSTGHIDLLFTDVVMPHMSGTELADRMRALYPDTRILFTSAYSANAIIHQGVFPPGAALLQKPFTPSALARRVREVLDSPGAPK